MRIAIVMDQPMWYDGVTYTTDAPFINFILGLSEYASKLVIFIPVRHSNKEKGNFAVFFKNNIEVIPLPFFYSAADMYMRMLHIFPRMIRIFNKNINAWDIACVIGTHFNMILFHHIAKKNKKKVCYYIRSNIIEELSLHKFRTLVKIVFRISEKIVHNHLKKGTTAFVIGEELKQIYGKHTRNIAEIYPTLIKESDIASQKMNWKSEPGYFTIIVVGRLTHEKGLDVLFAALAKVRKQINIKCLLVGDGRLEGQLRLQAADVHIGDIVEFMGFIQPGEPLFKLYDSADAYVLSSYTEGLPKTLYEAMARGLPIISTRVGGISRIIEEGKNGSLVTPGDPSLLANAITSLFADPEKRDDMSKNNLQKASLYTIEKQIKRMYTLIEDVFTRKDND